MKKIIKEPISVFYGGDSSDMPGLPRTVEYPHDSLILEEVAGRVFNKHLVMEERKDYQRIGKTLVFRLIPSKNPMAVSLNTVVYVSDLESAIERRSSEMIMANLCEKAVEDLLNNAFEAVTTVHHLERSFWKRVKFLFRPKEKIKV